MGAVLGRRACGACCTHAPAPRPTMPGSPTRPASLPPPLAGPASLQALGLRALWRVNSPSDRHEPLELLTNDLPQARLCLHASSGRE